MLKDLYSFFQVYGEYTVSLAYDMANSRKKNVRYIYMYTKCKSLYVLAPVLLV